MDINEILSNLGLDFSNPETKRGAMDAIEAILGSRQPPVGGMGGSSDEVTEVELDPDLIQPSIKHRPEGSDEDIEVEDEEDILSQMKHNDSDEDPSDNTSGDTSSSQDSDKKNSADKPDSSDGNGDLDTEDSDDSDDAGDFDDSDTDDSEIDDSKDTADSDDAKDTGDDEDSDADDNDADMFSDDDDADTALGDDENDTEDDIGDGDDEGDEEDGLVGDDEEEEDEDPDEYDPADDILDDTFDQSFEDEEVRTKQDARRIKRERTLEAAKKALADAKAKNVSASLIKELESAISALEALTEAVKSIKDISDEEFNQLINRVFDAIDAVGDTSLTFSSEEERESRVKEIKADLASAETQNELSAEDAARIRAENQAVKAREKETDKYRAKARGSFKGFQDFLTSLYRAIALQVHTEETNDSSWSALSRRNSGAGVMQQGKRIQELNNKKIPVIDFYFDQSGSWSDKDISVGQKAVSQLADMEANGQIKINIYYFSDDVFTDAASARAEGGTSGWNEIVKNVIATQATNVVIMTDSDMENWWNGDKALSYTVPGYVWYLWRNGTNAPRLPRDLKGRGGVQQFSFDTSTDA
jgi:hypothetical protein